MRRRVSESGGRRTTAGNAARIGGLGGILYVLLFVPAYIVGYPDAPDRASTDQGVFDYFAEGAGTFLFFNGTLSILALFFLLWFLGALHSVLQSAEGNEEGGWLSSAALVGGVVFATLSFAGVAVEIVHPATLSRFEDFEPDSQLVFMTLALASWLYHFCQVGTSVLVTATSLLALRTGVLPTWLAWAGFVVALLALLHVIIPLLGALVGLLWIAVVSVLMLLGSVGPSPARR
ncbi:MAG: hypothetical protein LC781_15325 [Actinobacteria bacterium]|nr:hypothetical protein [Actinomycetota bacterium]